MSSWTRRDVLRFGGGAAAGLALGAPTVLLSACSSGGDSRSGLTALASDLEGTLLVPSDATYATTALTKNLEFATVRPVAIAQVANAQDIATTLRWARENETPLVAQAGGHSYAGYSTTDGVIVDLSRLTDVDVDDSTGVVDIGAGGALGDVDDALAAHNITVPAGRCPTVGIAGLTLGGGFGFSARQFGLTCDNLIETQIVTVDGEILVCNENENADLFWACRGGGGGNFGINVSFKFQGRDVDQASVFDLSWDGFDSAEEIWAAIQQATLGAPDRDFSLELGISMSDGGTGGPATTESVFALGQFFGEVDDLREILAPMLAVAEPTSQVIEGSSFAGVTDQLKAGTTPDAFLSKSNFLSAPIPDDGLGELVEQMRQFPTDGRSGEFKIFTWGGAIADLARDATAFAHRDAQWINEGGASWPVGAADAVESATKQWIEDTYERMGSYLDDSAYQNFIDPTLADWQQAYYGENLPRLREVKARYDPDNFLQFAQGIQPA